VAFQFWLQAGEKAVRCGATNVSELDELSFVKELHLGYGFV
jgi:aspartate kinase